MSELERLKNQYVDAIKCGRLEEGARILAKRDELLLAELVNVTDIALMLSVSGTAVSNWKGRYDDFPAPLIGEGRTARYSRSEVLRWWVAHHPEVARAIKEAT